MPKVCPIGDEHCRIRIKTWRARKFGPRHPLAVAVCLFHRLHFTLYPPGFTPHARTPLVDLTPSGRPIPPPAKERPFSRTLFKAVLDGSQGIAWPKESDEGYQTQRFTTQVRHIQRAIAWLGLARGSPEDAALQCLQLPGMLLKRVRERVAKLKGFAERSLETEQVIRLLPECYATYQTLVTLGHLAGFLTPRQARG